MPVNILHHKHHIQDIWVSSSSFMLIKVKLILIQLNLVSLKLTALFITILHDH